MKKDQRKPVAPTTGQIKTQQTIGLIASEYNKQAIFVKGACYA